MTAFDSALRSPSNPDALDGKKPRGVAGQTLLSDDWGLEELPKGEWKAPLAGNVGGQWRIQEVLSPDFVIEAADVALGGIGVDPCASTDPANWFARRNMSLAEEAWPLEHELQRIKELPNTRTRQKELTQLLKPYYLGGSLVCDWGDFRDGAYGNVPFGFLRPWMLRFQREGMQNFRRSVGFWPVRPHRAWWIKALVGAEVVFLESQVVFKGHRSAFPAPLCLCSWNCRIPNLGKRETGRWRP